MSGAHAPSTTIQNRRIPHYSNRWTGVTVLDSIDCNELSGFQMNYLVFFYQITATSLITMNAVRLISGREKYFCAYCEQRNKHISTHREYKGFGISLSDCMECRRVKLENRVIQNPPRYGFLHKSQ